MMYVIHITKSKGFNIQLSDPAGGWTTQVSSKKDWQGLLIVGRFLNLRHTNGSRPA